MRTSDFGQGRRAPAGGAARRRPGRVEHIHPEASAPAAEAVLSHEVMPADDAQAVASVPETAKRRRPTIQWVAKRGLCTGCGACAGVCPSGALRMHVHAREGSYVPRIDKSQCIRCGLCLDVCPGHSVDFEGLGTWLFGDIPEDIALGRYLGSYIGHAADKDLRYDCSSGGLVSSLLIYALEQGLIDGALVTRMRPGKPLEPEPFIARTREQILSAAGSKYCPVPADIALREILGSKGRFAVVGLPCHIQAVRKAEQHIEKLRERIRYRISIACSLDYSFWGTVRFLQTLGISPGAVAKLEYRGHGWPGAMRICLRDGSETRVALADYYKKLGPFALRRCTLCSDLTGELSDLSCGDAWTPEAVARDKLGSSFVLTRTPEAEELLESAAADRAVELSELSIAELKVSQAHAIFKKRKLNARMALFRWTGRSVPCYYQRLLRPVRGDHRDAIKFYLTRSVLSGNRPILRRLLHATRLLKRKNQQGSAAT